MPNRIAGILLAVLVGLTGRMYAQDQTLSHIVEVTTNTDVSDAQDVSSINALRLDPGADGLISLREAIDAANNTPNSTDMPVDTIIFSGSVGDATNPILIGTGAALALRDTTGGTVINGTDVVLDGKNATNATYGLVLVSASNIVAGLTIVNFDQAGIYITGTAATTNIVMNCRIGILNNVAAPNGVAGVLIGNGATGNLIGGGSGASNVISGNGEIGVFLMGVGTAGNSVVGNYIGTNETGDSAVPNGYNGITIAYGASSNIIGHVIAEGRNIISGNGRSGVFIYDNANISPGTSTGNMVIGNYIGIAANGASALGNGYWGVYIGNGPTGNMIGGTDAENQNAIAHNGRDGIEVNGDTSDQNSLRGNRIWGNGELCIDLFGDANDSVPAPVITSASPIRGTTSAPESQVDLYYGPNASDVTFLETVSPNLSGQFVSTTDLSGYGADYLMATVTDSGGNTSEFSNAYAIVGSAEGEGEGEGEPEPELGVWIEITDADDICYAYLNGNKVLEINWGDGPGGPTGIHAPGYSGPVDVTSLLETGNNTFRFAVYNSAACCGVSGHFEVRVQGHRVYYNGIDETNSSEGIKFFDTFVLEYDASKADYFAYAVDHDSGAPVPQAVVRVAEAGGTTTPLVGTAALGEDGMHRFLLDKPGSYRVAVSATGYQTVSAETPLEVTADTDWLSNRFILYPVNNGSVDSDGDGLSDADEISVYGTNPGNSDSDGDGMGDLFEVQYGLDNALDDSMVDTDNDGIANLYEFLLRSDPLDPSKPRTAYYVATNGNDSNAGTSEAPWKTISHAIEEIAEAIGEIPENDLAARLRALADGTAATIVCGAGTYTENITLSPGIRIKGADTGGTSLVGSAIIGADKNGTIIVGSVTGSAFSSLVNVTVREPAAGLTQLVYVDDGPMLFHRVTVQGRVSASTATGIVFDGDRSRFVLLNDSLITKVNTGIIIRDAIPLVRRTVFKDIYGDAIVLKATARKIDEDNTLGIASDSGTGWNRFEDIGDKAIVNERSTPIQVEANDWDTDDPAEIADMVEGNVDYEPYLAKGAGLLPSSLVCTVWTADTRDPILNAALSIQPGGLDEVTDNVDGVYTFSAIPSGTYTVSASVPGFAKSSKNVTIESGATISVVLPVGDKANSGGDTCGCGKLNVNAKVPAQAHAGNALVALLTIGATLAARRMRKR